MEHHNLFDEKSNIYALSRPKYPPELYQYLISLCQENSQAWDCACGNGQAAVDLSPFFDEVHATDISNNQIKEIIPYPYKNIKYSVQPAERTTFACNQFDLVCVAQALHWFNHDKFWPELKRVLKPNGIFAAWGYSWFSISPKIDNVIKSSLLNIIQPYWASQNKFLWNQYKDIPIPLPLLQTPKIKMDIEWNLEELYLYFHSWSATRTCMNILGNEFYKNSYQKTQNLWENVKEKKKVSMEFCLIVAQNLG